MSSTMSKIGARDLGTALTASNSSPPRIVNVADGSTVRELSRLEAAVSSLTVSRIAAWMEQLPSPAKGLKKIPDEIFAQIIGWAGNHHSTACVNKSWKEMTLKSYKETLVSYTRDPYSLVLLNLATQRVIPTATGALTPEEYMDLDDVTCNYIVKNIKVIKDENLIRFFQEISVFKLEPVEGISFTKLTVDFTPTGHPDDIHLNASAIRRWMSQNTAILGQIQTLDIRSCLLEVVPPEVSLLRNLVILGLPGNRTMALPSEICQLADLECLNIARNMLTALPETLDRLADLRYLYLEGNQFTARPAVLDRMPLLETVDLSGNPIQLS